MAVGAIILNGAHNIQLCTRMGATLAPQSGPELLLTSVQTVTKACLCTLVQTTDQYFVSFLVWMCHARLLITVLQHPGQRESSICRVATSSRHVSAHQALHSIERLLCTPLATMVVDRATSCRPYELACFCRHAVCSHVGTLAERTLQKAFTVTKECE